MIITIAGDPGSGKSTVGKLVAKNLGIPYFSLGDRRAEYAKELGLNLDELNAKSDLDPAIDQIFDDWQETLGEQKGDFVLDSLLGWHFYPSSIKIYLGLDSGKAAERIFTDRKQNETRADEPEYANVEEVERIINQRKQGNWTRLGKIIKKTALMVLGSVPIKSQFDLYLDTGEFSIAEVVEKVVEKCKTSQR